MGFTFIVRLWAQEDTVVRLWAQEDTVIFSVTQY